MQSLHAICYLLSTALLDCKFPPFCTQNIWTLTGVWNIRRIIQIGIMSLFMTAIIRKKADWHNIYYIVWRISDAFQNSNWPNFWTNRDFSIIFFSSESWNIILSKNQHRGTQKSNKSNKNNTCCLYCHFGILAQNHKL